MLKHTLDIIRQANVESITKHQLEYECHSCGGFYESDDIEERVVSNQGELETVLVCPKCISLGWDEWRID